MMKNLLFLQALLLSSIHSSAAADEAGLRGALQNQAEVVQGVRSLKKGGKKGGKKGYSSGSSSEEGYYDDGYYDDDYYYGNGNGKGKGGGKGGGGKKGGGKKGGKGNGGRGNRGKGNGGGYYDDDYTEKHDDFYPVVDDIAFLDDQYFDDAFFEDDDCELVTLNETFTVPRASRYLAPDTTPEEMGDPTLIGTVFIWENQQIYEPDGEVPIVGTRVSGTCTRTTTDDEGMGSCQLVFVDDDEYTINVDGLLTGPFGSQLAITGGTGGMVGVIGEMDFFPIFNMGEFDGDIFINVTRYEIEADLGLIVCPNTN